MATLSITIEVDEAAARAYAKASPEEQRKIRLLMSLRLSELTGSSSKSLRAAIKEVSTKAADRGLTPEILESILRDEEE